MTNQNTQETLKATGHLKIDHFNSKGDLIDSRFIPNLVVQVGKNFIASRMIGTSNAVMSHMEVGTGNTAPVAGDTTLQAAVAGSRVVFSSAASVGANIVSYSASFAPGIGSGALVEAGIFNAASGGIMLCRTTFAVVNKEIGDTINISWSVSVA